MRRVRARFGAVAALLAGVLLACGPRLPPVPLSLPKLFEATPAVWRATAPGGGVAYLMGSVHLTRRHIDDFGSVANSSWEEADELVVEVDVSLLSPQDMAALSARYGALAPPRTLRDELSPHSWERLSAYLESRGIAEELVAGWKPWFVYFVIVQHELARAGFKTEAGVDRMFIESAVAGDVPIVSLESAASQLQVFDNLPDSLEEVLLQDSLARVDDFAGEADAMIDAWSGGDEAELESLVFQPLTEVPELEVFYDLVFFQRNRQMAGRLHQWAKDGKTRFVVVGAGHMVGEQGIPTLLAERGWQVERLRGEPRTPAPAPPVVGPPQ